MMNVNIIEITRWEALSYAAIIIINTEIRIYPIAGLWYKRIRWLLSDREHECNRKAERSVKAEIMKMYTALFIDVKDSQSYADEQRFRIQVYMQSYINLLNKLFREDIAHDVVINAGDSMQGLFKSTTTAVMYFRLMELLMHPVRIRAGIGIGEWNIQIRSQDVGLEYVTSAQQDGQTYHLARKAIDEVYKKPLHNVHICSDEDDTFTNYLLNASKTIKEDQIHKQNQVLLVMELLYPFRKEKQHLESEDVIIDLLKMKLSYQHKLRQRLETYADRISNSYVEASMAIDFKKNMDDKVCLERSVVICDPIAIDGQMKTPEKSILKKNMAERIAKILGCSRQNAASIIKSGNANKIREMDYMALQYIEQKYGAAF